MKKNVILLLCLIFFNSSCNDKKEEKCDNINIDEIIFIGDFNFKDIMFSSIKVFQKNDSLFENCIDTITVDTVISNKVKFCRLNESFNSENNIEIKVGGLDYRITNIKVGKKNARTFFSSTEKCWITSYRENNKLCEERNICLYKDLGGSVDTTP